MSVFGGPETPPQSPAKKMTKSKISKKSCEKKKGKGAKTHARKKRQGGKNSCVKKKARGQNFDARNFCYIEVWRVWGTSPVTIEENDKK